MSKASQQLVIPYRHIPAKQRNDATSGMISQSLPMAAMFMRNKLLSWTSFFLAVQAYLNEPINKQSTKDDSSAQPPLLRIVFALIAVITCYIDLIFPATGNNHKQVAQKLAEAAASATASSLAAAAT